MNVNAISDSVNDFLCHPQGLIDGFIFHSARLKAISTNFFSFGLIEMISYKFSFFSVHSVLNCFLMHCTVGITITLITNQVNNTRN